jgi:hypothetical protein
MNAATPSERLAAMRLLIERSWALLQHNPRKSGTGADFACIPA